MTLPKPEDILLPLEVGGLKLRNPFVVGSGPATKTVEQLVEAERWGWAAASTKLAMDPAPYVSLPPRYRWLARQGYHVFSAETRLTIEEGLKLIEAGRHQTRELVLIANMAYTGKDGLEGWGRTAQRLESAGAHAVELNLCCPNMSFNAERSTGTKASDNVSGATLGTDPRPVALIAATVKDAVGIPVFAKISPEAGNIAHVAAAAFDAGANAVASVGNRLGIPPFDPTDPAAGFYRAQRGMSLGCLSGPILTPLALRDVFEIRKAVGPDACVVGMGGVANAEDAIRFAMCGADLVGICTATMLKGFAFLPSLIQDVHAFLGENGFSNWRDLRDRVHPHVLPAGELHIIDVHATVDEDRCTGCGRCLAPAHCHAIRQRDDGKAQVDPSLCLGCSTCVDLCKAGALRMVEREA